MGGIPDAAKEHYELPAGLYVTAVSEGSDAEKQGLLPGDIVTAVNGTPVTTTEEINAMKEELNVGDSMDFTIWREGESFTVTVKLVDTIGPGVLAIGAGFAGVLGVVLPTPSTSTGNDSNGLPKRQPVFAKQIETTNGQPYRNGYGCFCLYGWRNSFNNRNKIWKCEENCGKISSILLLLD